MTDSAAVREIIERVVAEVIERHTVRLREEVVHSLAGELQPALAPTSGRLKAALAAVEEATAQSDILRALLDGAAGFSGRTALFLVRGTTAAGWQARGFRENDAVKLLTMDVAAGLAGQAFQQRTPVAGPVAKFESRFVASFGAPVDGTCLVLPLVIRDKTAALLYADAGSKAGQMDRPALEVLVRAAGVWLELLALRKAHGQPAAASAPYAAAAPQPPSATPVMAPVVSPEAVPPPSVRMAAAASGSAPFAAMARGGEAAPATSAAFQGSTNADDELHRKARRFAKLLIDEIKLYNQAKVKEGKLHNDLYDRLRDDIDKSRATFDKRYAQTSVAVADYFNQELIRGLADNDSRLLGSNFPR